MSRRASGLKAWAIQRGTALYLTLFLFYLVAKLAFSSAPDSYDNWRAWMGHPLVSVAVLVFVAALLIHAWIGVRDIVIDYLRQPAARMVALGLVALVLVGCGLWAGQVLILARIV